MQNPPIKETSEDSFEVTQLNETPKTARSQKILDTPKTAASFLKTIPPFTHLTLPQLESLARYCRFATIAAGEYVSTEGDEEGLYCFIVVTGRLSMMKTSLSGKELVVELLGPKDNLSLIIALSLEKLPLQLSTRAQSESKILWIPISQVTAILQQEPLLYRELFATLLHSLQRSYQISRGLAHDRVEVRIATVLISLSSKFARPPPAPQDQTIDITRQQIADLTGTTPETAIRVTRAFQRQKVIDIRRPGIVKVLDIPALEEIIEGE